MGRVEVAVLLEVTNLFGLRIDPFPWQSHDEAATGDLQAAHEFAFDGRLSVVVGRHGGLKAL
jgi:hypothetical protein